MPACLLQFLRTQRTSQLDVGFSCSWSFPLLGIWLCFLSIFRNSLWFWILFCVLFPSFFEACHAPVLFYQTIFSTLLYYVDNSENLTKQFKMPDLYAKHKIIKWKLHRTAKRSHSLIEIWVIINAQLPPWRGKFSFVCNLSKRPNEQRVQCRTSFRWWPVHVRRTKLWQPQG